MIVPGDAEYYVERSEADAGVPIMKLRQWDIDPTIGDFGGFFLTPFWTEHPAIQAGDPKTDAPTMRTVLDERDSGHVDIVTGQAQREYRVVPIRADAVFLAGIKVGWTWHRVLRAPAAAPAPAPVAEAQPAITRTSDAMDAYRALQAKVAAIQAAGGPVIALNSKRAELQAYVEANSGQNDEARDTSGGEGSAPGPV